MPHKLPKQLPKLILIGDKTFKLITPKESITRKVCQGNDGSWFYYFNQKVVDGSTAEIGQRRHFSVRQAVGQRAVHISMKPSENKQDEIMIWYRYDEQWTGKRMEAVGWGKTNPYPGQNVDRVNKAVKLLETFLKAMTAVAEGGAAVPIQPCLTPPLVPVTTWDGFPPPIPVSLVPVSNGVSTLSGKEVVDYWDD